MLNMCVSGSPNDRAIACANWLDFQTFCENWKNKTNGARTEKNTASWFDLAQLLRGVLQCDVGRLHSSWTSDISSSTAAVTRLFCAEGISPAVFFFGSSEALDLTWIIHKSFWRTKCRARQHGLYINHTQQQAGRRAAETHPASVWLLFLYGH